MLPRLHVVTDDDVLARPDAEDRMRALLRAGTGDVALHLRGHRTSAARLHALAAALMPVARSTGAALIVNDRVDIALALARAGTPGVQLGRRSLPVDRARELLGPGTPIGYSAHDADEAASAVAAGASFVVVGPIWETASHPGRPESGLALVREARAAVVGAAAIVAIGGVEPGRVEAALVAGADGVAVLSGVWRETDPAESARRYLEALNG